MTLAYFYRGQSLGPTGSIIVVVAVAARLGWMFWRRRSRR